MEQLSSLSPERLPQRLPSCDALLDNVDVFIFDCDGVLWRGDEAVEGTPAALDELRRRGKKVLFLTNNSTKSRAGFRSKLISLNFTVNEDEIYTSSFAAVAYFLKTRFADKGKKVYIVGEEGIQDELDLAGIPWIGGENDKDKTLAFTSGNKINQDPDVGAVVVGFDRHLNYYKLNYAQLCLSQNQGCEFVATNTDMVAHHTDVQEWAGGGTMVGAIKGCTGKEPIVTGKPAPLMIEYILEKHDIKDRSRVCMVGDRLDTDILFGAENGLRTCLTLSGVTSLDEVIGKCPRQAGTENIHPDFYVDSVCNLVK